MNTRPKRWCWRKDLSEFRGLTDRERANPLFPFPDRLRSVFSALDEKANS